MSSGSAVAPPDRRWLIYLEAAAGIAVVVGLLARTYGAVPALTFALAAGAVAYTGWMIVQMLSSLSDPSLDVVGKVRNFERERLEGEKQLLLRGIKDLEADHATGKMDEADYQRLRASAEARALEIIRGLRETESRYTKAAEALVRSRVGTLPPAAAPAGSGPKPPSPTGPAPAAAPAATDLFDERPVTFSGTVCAGCGFDNPEPGRFCAGCGRPREGATGERP